MVGNFMIDSLMRLLQKATIEGLEPQLDRKDKASHPGIILSTYRKSKDLGGGVLVFRIDSPVCKFETFYPFKMFYIVCNKH